MPAIMFFYGTLKNVPFFYEKLLTYISDRDILYIELRYIAPGYIKIYKEAS